MTPGYVKVMYWGGIGLAAVGAVVVGATYLSYDGKSTTQPDFNSLRLENAGGWAAIGVGGGAFAAALLLRPPLPSAPSATSRLSLGTNSIRWEGSF